MPLLGALLVGALRVIINHGVARNVGIPVFHVARMFAHDHGELALKIQRFRVKLRHLNIVIRAN